MEAFGGFEMQELLLQQFYKGAGGADFRAFVVMESCWSHEKDQGKRKKGEFRSNLHRRWKVHDH